MKIVCRCEDLTENDIVKAIREGYRDIESLKRITGFGTGPCQGKGCTLAVMKILARETGRDPKELRPFTARTPLDPVYLGVFVIDRKH